MEMGEKIFTLRKQLGLTLEDVGNVVGVGKSTVRKWESGEIANMRRDKIALLAAALHTTPAYLMGWEEDKDLPAVSDEEVADDNLIRLWQSLTPDEIQRVKDFVQGMIAGRKEPSSRPE